jgi:hypothetical protein
MMDRHGDTLLPAPRVYTMARPSRWVLLGIGLATLPVFLLGVFAIRLSSRRLILESDALVVRSLRRRRIPYSAIEGTDFRVGKGWGIVVRDQGFLNIPVHAFDGGEELKRQLSLRIGRA